MRRLVSSIIAVVFVAMLSAISYGCVYAVSEIHQGEGGAASGTTAGCGSPHAYSSVCGNGRGGYQWGLIPVSELDSLEYYGPIMSNTDNRAAMKQQAKDLGAKWVAVCYFVGTDGKKYGPIQYHNGEVRFPKGTLAQYNSTNAQSLAAALAAIAKGVNSSIVLPALGADAIAALLANVLTLDPETGFYILTDPALAELLKDVLRIDPDKPVPSNNNICTSWEPGSYKSSYNNDFTGEGATSVVIKIKNDVLSGKYGGWQGNVGDMRKGEDRWIYAMPTDTVNWQSCYFPGVQYVANSWTGQEYHGEHKCPSGGELNYGYFTPCQAVTDSKGEECLKAKGWDNGYKIWLRDGSLDKGYSPAINAHMYGTSDEYAPGEKDIRDAGKNSQTFPQKGSVGRWSMQEIESGSPVYYRRFSRHHEWECCDDEGCWMCDHGDDNPPNPYTFYEGESDDDDPNSDSSTSTKKDGPAVSSAGVRIPYNYDNEPIIMLEDVEQVYSGDIINVLEAKIDINTKYNEATERAYTTEVHNAWAKIYAYVSSEGSGELITAEGPGYNFCEDDGSAKAQGQCYYQEWSGTMNGDGELWGFEQRFDWEGKWNVFDAEAGMYMCFRVSTYPTTSNNPWNNGNGEDMDPSGDNTTTVSAPSCVQIAKLPTFHVYGGSVYTAGSIKTATQEKNIIYDIRGGGDWMTICSKADDKAPCEKDGHFWGNDKIYSYETMEKYGHKTLFSSYSEEAVIANGGSSLVSGAAIAFNKEEKVKSGVKTNIGVGAENAAFFCGKLSPLSLANNSGKQSLNLCPTILQTGFANIPSYTNRKELVDYWAGNKSSQTVGDTIDARTSGELLPSTTGRIIRQIVGGGELNLNGFDVYNKETFIIRSDGNTININGDIKYSDSDMQNGGDVPKVVIYADNINIKCSVNQLDAILIAEGTVNTCSNASSNVDSRERSNQLKLRGMVIANTMVLPRTYGTASGYWSGLAAEEINYDTSALLWGRYMAGSGESGTLTTVYQSELPTRY